MKRNRLSPKQKRELKIWRQYLEVAEVDYKTYVINGRRTDLAGRAIKDIRDRFRRMVARAEKGLPTPY
jgi:hypothetical protein